MSDESEDGVWNRHSVFRYFKLDENGASTDFENSYAKTDTPVKTLNTINRPSDMKEGEILRIHYRLKPTNAVTYTLRLYDSNVAADYESNLHLLYESPAARASDTDYDVLTLPVPFTVGVLGNIFFALEWTGAPGTTVGFIEVSGERIT